MGHQILMKLLLHIRTMTPTNKNYNLQPLLHEIQQFNNAKVCNVVHKILQEEYKIKKKGVHTVVV